jgi:ATP/maltotriose-dependent transcriptional regulator MalT
LLLKLQKKNIILADKSGKKSRKAITLDTKIGIIKLSEDGVSNSEIGRRLDLACTTVVTVIKNKKKILDEVQSATPVL